MSILGTLDSLIVRETAHPPLFTKGSELTYAEWDARTVAFYDAIQSIVYGGNVETYNPSTIYDDSSSDVYKKFAGYGSRIWQAIGTFSNETPEEGIYWTQITLAQLIPDVLKLAQLKRDYTTTANIPTGATGVTIQIPLAYPGTVKGVTCWDGNVQIYPTVVRGNDGTYETVQLISGKAYTAAEVNITLK